MKSNLAYLHSYKQRLAFISVSVAIIALSIYFNFFQKTENPEFSKLTFSETKTEILPLNIAKFNPNTLSTEEWKALGFSEKQVATILKYKEIVGGAFTSKNQLKKCYAISEEKFSQLEAYILLTDEAGKKQNFKQNKWVKKELIISGKFNPDLYSEADWVKMGFSERQAAGILKYKNYLGGSFVSKEKFKECYMINEENYAKMSPFLLLPSKTPADFNPYKKNYAKEKRIIKYQNFDPNLLDFEAWKKLGFSDKQVQNILNYKERFLKGSFKTLDDVSRCYMISPEKFEEMKPFIKLNPDNFAVNNVVNSNVEMPKQKTDFAKIDLNKITFQQLKEFGFSDRAAASYLAFRKKLGGFSTKDQILKTYNIDKELTQKLIQMSTLSPLIAEK
ncbi:Helix-hairpin-helix motif-containing protein [Halpernia humi]|uniref:Helix-hairpin-helix motif-containing protein n=1 Tax=Halpernia humi TaxID=493375 RepID=A0A1H5T654_9FLAO|nr:helix-hairpin-helix domain-containing protein [Halpernia humi]SEF57581.1 Helix-hairpin-helix motif-containing protein [Halpernia humi]